MAINSNWSLASNYLKDFKDVTINNPASTIPTYTYYTANSGSCKQWWSTEPKLDKFICAQCNHCLEKMNLDQNNNSHYYKITFWCHGEILEISIALEVLYAGQNLLDMLLQYNPLFRNKDVYAAFMEKLYTIKTAYVHDNFNKLIQLETVKELKLLAVNFSEVKHLIANAAASIIQSGANRTYDAVTATLLHILECVDRKAAIDFVQANGPSLGFSNETAKLASQLNLFNPK